MPVSPGNRPGSAPNAFWDMENSAVDPISGPEPRVLKTHFYAASGAGPLIHEWGPVGDATQMGFIPERWLTVNSGPSVRKLSLACAVDQRGEGNDSVTKPFCLSCKQKMVARLTGKDAGQRAAAGIRDASPPADGIRAVATRPGRERTRFRWPR